MTFLPPLAPYPVTPWTPTVARWELWQQAQGHSDHTVSARVRRIHLFAEFIDGDPVTATTDDLVRYLASCPKARATRATYYGHLKAWFAWLARNDLRLDNPCLKIPSPRVPRRQPRAVTDREFDAILATGMHRRTRMMVLLAAYQGLRVHEIAKMRGEDVNLADGQLHVVGKGDLDVVLPLHPKVAQFAAAFPRSGWWFPTYKGGGAPIGPKSVSNIIHAVMQRADVAGGPHRLRHWYGTRLVADGVNIRVVQVLLRHASLQTTQSYCGVSFDQQREALTQLGA